MLNIKRFLVFASLVWSASACTQSPTEAEICASVAESDPRAVHLNSNCLSAAEQGDGASQYAVGMSFGYSGDRELEVQWYRRAAGNGVVAAYLALGHVLRGEPFNNPTEAISWYERFWDSGVEGRGYAALLISQLEAERGDEAASEQWLLKCRDTNYSGCE